MLFPCDICENTKYTLEKSPKCTVWKRPEGVDGGKILLIFFHIRKGNFYKVDAVVSHYAIRTFSSPTRCNPIYKYIKAATVQWNIFM